MPVRLAVFNLAPYEQEPLADWCAAHPDVEVVTSPDDLSPETAGLCEGCAGVVIQPLGELHDPALYAHLARLGVRVISLRMAGFDSVLPAVARQHGITVTNVPAYSPPAVAEMALSMLLRLNRHSPRVDRQLAAGDYRWDGLIGPELGSQTVGVVGVGRIGSVFARYCHALGARVLGYDISPSRDVEGLTYVDSLDELLAASDVVSLHVPLHESTRDLIDAARLARMRPGALLINCARGGVVDSDALVAALDSGHLGGAGLWSQRGVE